MSTPTTVFVTSASGDGSQSGVDAIENEEDPCGPSIRAYVDFVRSYGLLPVPAFWSDTNCTGQRFPVSTTDVPDTIDLGTSLSIPFRPKSYYCPPGTTFTTNSGKKSTGTNGPYVGLEVIVGSGVPSGISSATFVKPMFVDSSAPVGSSGGSGGSGVNTQIYDTSDEYKFNLCTSQDPQTISFSAQSFECDTFMSEVACKEGGQFEHDPMCGCFTDARALAKTFKSQTGDPINVPVRCMGATCGFGAYKTQEMLDQQCDVHICEKILNIDGANAVSQLIDDTNTTIYCGGYDWSKPTATASVTTLIQDPKQVTGNVKSSTKKLSTGTIVAIVLLSVAFVISLSILITKLLKRYRRK